MLLLTLNVIYVLLAIGMIVLVLMQRGAGAQAGSGFGGGASATVFGARGSSNFLSKSTKWLAFLFFSISLFMAWYATHKAQPTTAAKQDLGVMAQVPAAAPVKAPAAGSAIPGVPAQATPAAVAPATSTVPAVPSTQPATPQPQPATPPPGG